MFPNAKGSELLSVLATIDPAAQAAGTVTTGWFSVANHHGFLSLVQTGVLGTSATVDAKLQQAVDATGTSAKDISGKAITQIVKATGDNKQALINVKPEELDTVNGFARFQIAREDALQDGEIYGWRLNGSTGGLGNPLLSQAASVSYAAGRYGDGLMVKDTTRVAWGVNIPEVFNTSFWFAPSEITTCVIWAATGSSGQLLVGYDSTNGSFFLEDHLARRVSVAFSLSITDRICLGVCQTATERRLFAGRMGGDVDSASAAIAPVGTFNGQCEAQSLG